MKLLGSSRGEGALRTADSEFAVSYSLDTFQERDRTTVSGSLDGDASSVEDGAVGYLKLESGEEIKVALIKPDTEGADFKSV
jgi:hypothetical protein